MIGYLPDTAIKSARSKRHPLAHVPQQKAPLYLSVQCNIWHRKLNKEKYFMLSNPNFKKTTKKKTKPTPHSSVLPILEKLATFNKAIYDSIM